MDFQKLSYFLITGASKGIGKCVAIEISKKLKSGSISVLVARSESGVLATKETILKYNSDITVKTYSMDLENTNEENYYDIILDSLSGRDLSAFENALIVHNVGSIGDITKPAKKACNILEWSTYYNLNVFSVAALNSKFITIFKEQRKIIVNITSKCGIVPFKSMTFYCSAKAAREMYFRVLAEEESEMTILNYSPGPVDTDMSFEIQKNSFDEDLKFYFKNQREHNEILSPLQTTIKLISVLEANVFKSGDHVDYFD